MGKWMKAIVVGGLIAGALDILYAFIVYGPLSYDLAPIQVLHSVAGGWMGREAARAGGVETALIGLGTHFMIALFMASVYVAAAARFGALVQRPVVWGFLYGIVLYGVMNYVVVPLSAASPEGRFAADFADASARLSRSFSSIKTNDDYPWMIWGTLFTHTALVGIPIALAAKRMLRRQV